MIKLTTWHWNLFSTNLFRSYNITFLPKDGVHLVYVVSIAMYTHPVL